MSATANVEPKNTVAPMDWRLSAPAPVASISGSAPAAVASVVISTGRRRTVAASMIASTNARPWSRSWFANSTIRMPFLLAMPISITEPIWL